MSGPILLWSAGALGAIGVALLTASRPFKVEKLSIFGVEATLTKPLESGGLPRLGVAAIVVLIGAALAAVWGTKETLFVPTWPTRLKQVKSAEIQIAEVDDKVDVLVNGVHVAHAEWGETPPWLSIKQQLRRGPNALEIWVTNGEWGGCGANVALRLNGILDPNYVWSWKENENQMPKTVCFRVVKTLNLD